jgi:hypothetical protein
MTAQPALHVVASFRRPHPEAPFAEAQGLEGYSRGAQTKRRTGTSFETRRLRRRPSGRDSLGFGAIPNLQLGGRHFLAQNRTRDYHDQAVADSIRRSYAPQSSWTRSFQRSSSRAQAQRSRRTIPLEWREANERGAKAVDERAKGPPKSRHATSDRSEEFFLFQTAVTH